MLAEPKIVRELKVKGWPRGWKQMKTRTMLIITGPKKTGFRYSLSLDSYRRLGVDLRQGASYEWFVRHAADDLLSHVSHYHGLMTALKANVRDDMRVKVAFDSLFGLAPDSMEMTKGC